MARTTTKAMTDQKTTIEALAAAASAAEASAAKHLPSKSLNQNQIQSQYKTIYPQTIKQGRDFIVCA
jgi:hypothetical protein